MLIPPTHFLEKNANNVHFIFFYIYYYTEKEKEKRKKYSARLKKNVHYTCTLAQKRALSKGNVHYGSGRVVHIECTFFGKSARKVHVKCTFGSVKKAHNVLTNN